MTGARAKRLAIRWARYVGRLPAGAAGAGGGRHGGVYLGHARAYSRYVYAGRTYPTGVRVPWQPLATGLHPHR